VNETGEPDPGREPNAGRESDPGREAVSGDQQVEIADGALVLLVGAAGSGKSSLAARLFEPGSVLSSDAIRAELSGDESNQAVTRTAFRILHERAERRLLAGELTVVDATNIGASARQPLIRQAASHRRPVTVLVLDLPAEVCLARNAGRPGRVVPAAAVERQLTRLRRELDRGLLDTEARRGADHRVIVLSTPAEVAGLTIRRAGRLPRA
jgi:protein phosphatase